MRSQDITVRDVKDTRSWILIAFYAIAVPLAISYVGWQMIDGNTYTAAGASAGFVFLLFGLCIAALAGIIKDTIYLREVRAGWTPKWSVYLGAPLGVSVLGYFSAGVLGIEAPAGALSLLVAMIAIWISSVSYLRQRHRAIGVP